MMQTRVSEKRREKGATYIPTYCQNKTSACNSNPPNAAEGAKSKAIFFLRHAAWGPRHAISHSQ